MATYSVHIPASGARARDPATAPVFVPDRFSWAAYAFGPLWCLARRCWLAFVLWSVVVGAALALALKVPSSIVVLGPVSVFLALAFGFEANAMRRRALERRGYPIVDYVVAANVEQAEQRFFERWATESQVPPAPPAPRPPDAASRQPYSGLGLFSEQGG